MRSAEIRALRDGRSPAATGICGSSQFLASRGSSIVPVLRGNASARKKDWIYIWYRRNPSDALYRFARDKRWKLYDSGKYPRAGKLYDVSADVLEQKAVEPDSSEAAKAAHKKLQAAIDSMKPNETGGLK